MEIVEYTDQYRDDIIRFIVGIQHDEMGVDITAADQPDLANIRASYQQKGNFWMMLDKGSIVGTIALNDIGNGEGALRKMFVHPEYRGKEIGVAQALLKQLLSCCREREIKTVFLGTIDMMKAAHRFYEKNGFVRLTKEELPSRFPVMRVDNTFYKYSFTSPT